MTNKSNVNLLSKKNQKASKFGENLHYLTEENVQRLWDVIDNYEHKLCFGLYMSWAVVLENLSR